MLTGNTSAIDDGLLQNFRYGGIAHIFAVSGLHIGVIFGALYALCKALKLNKYLSTIVCVLCVFAYTGICGFTASSMRSAIMCSVLSASRLFHGKYDGLNSLSVSAILLLIINPLWLFTLGFQLSFGAVVSIYLFSNTFNKLFAFLPKKIGNSLGVSLSVQAGSLPIMLNSFGYLSVAGIFLNIIAIPVLSFILVLILLCVVLSMVIPPLAPIFIEFSTAPLQLIISALSAFGMESAIIRSSGLSFITPFWYVILIAISQIINFKLPTRAIISCVSTVIIVATAILCAFSPITGTSVHITASHNGEGVVIARGGKSVIIITENSTNRFIESVINEYCLIAPSAIVVLGEEDSSFYATFQIDNLCKVVYLPPESINPDDLSGKDINYQVDFNIDGVRYKYLNGRDLLVYTEGITVGISCGEDTQISYCDLLISNQINTSLKPEHTVYFSIKDYKYNIYNYGDLHFYAKNDKINLQGILPNKESLY
ncbi:MAG: ComEC/Rec2 family competence protein [Clostridiales bacterium]|nr:ComEC/Rec2 family competence protein [Clostridiales bacterium]